jgi:hypothetical protein
MCNSSKLTRQGTITLEAGSQEARDSYLSALEPVEAARGCRKRDSSPTIVYMSKGLTLAALALAISGCAQDPVFPKLAEEPITLSMTASSRSFKAGTPDTLRVTITNTLAEVARLRYNSSCQLELFVRDSKGNVVIPSGGKSQCLPIVSTLDIPAKGSIVRMFIWNGGTAFLPTVTSDRVPAGSYYLSPEINALNYSTVLPALKIDVTD